MRLNKYILLAFASIICAVVLWYSNVLVSDMQREETKRMEIWAEATKLLASSASTDLSESDMIELLLQIIQENSTIPVVVVDENDSIVSMRNVTINDSIASKEEIAREVSAIIGEGSRIDIVLDDGAEQHLYYANSYTINRLAYFPLIQLGLVALFLLFAYVVFRHARKLEQDKVWIGLARETAHQLGTPISALSGWIELLRSGDIDPNIVANEIGNDTERLKAIADRFSKIGSLPEMHEVPIITTIQSTIDYLRSRIPSSVELKILCADDKISPMHNPILMGWTIENLCRNAVDAMDGKGIITVDVSKNKNRTIIDVIDTGKGMSYKTARNIFQAGFTTKMRGWGIGLALAKRIVEKYHRGHIFVYQTEIGVGTIIRIILK